MKFLADMGISPRVVSALRTEGHDAVHLQEQELGRLLDGEILAKARAKAASCSRTIWILGNLAASGGALPSVVIFRLKDMRAESVRHYLFKIIEQQSETLAKGAVFSVNERKIRFRTLPF